MSNSDEALPVRSIQLKKIWMKTHDIHDNTILMQEKNSENTHDSISPHLSFLLFVSYVKKDNILLSAWTSLCYKI